MYIYIYIYTRVHIYIYIYTYCIYIYIYILCVYIYIYMLLRGVGTRRYFFPPNASVQWQPDGSTIRTKEWFLGAGFLGAPPISLERVRPFRSAAPPSCGRFKPRPRARQFGEPPLGQAAFAWGWRPSFITLKCWAFAG